ncbi:MAG: hypothetical protein D6717_03465 [Gammaproteobacteria bacterium]|nr:MAG: hypothetical protein D6717_03465 [Gammaproteobacteria bacterium]
MRPGLAIAGALLMVVYLTLCFIALYAWHARSLLPEAAQACAEVPLEMAPACAGQYMEQAFEATDWQLTMLVLLLIPSAMISWLLLGRHTPEPLATAAVMGGVGAVLLALLLSPERVPAIAALLGALLGGFLRPRSRLD